MDIVHEALKDESMSEVAQLYESLVVLSEDLPHANFMRHLDSEYALKEIFEASVKKDGPLRDALQAWVREVRALVHSILENRLAQFRMRNT